MFPQMTSNTSTAEATDAIISAFENKNNIKLPDLYRQFLKQTNGGRPDRDKYPIVGLANNPFGGIQTFFGFNKLCDVDNLSNNYDFYSDKIPHGVLLIAGNGGGDYVCLDLRSGKERVVFWDNRHFWGTGEWREIDLYRIADNFAEFTRALRQR